jgi:hypothetical protein
MARTAPISVIAAFRSARGVRAALRRLARTGIEESRVHVVGFKPTEEGGGRSKSGAAKTAEGDALVSVKAESEDTAEQARIVLEESGAERVEAIDVDGKPLLPKSEAQ